MPERDYGLADLALKRGQIEGSRLRDLSALQAASMNNIAQINARADLARGERMSDLTRNLALIGTKAVGDWQDQKQNAIVNQQKADAFKRQQDIDARDTQLKLQGEERAQQTFSDQQKATGDKQRHDTLLSDFYRRSFDPETQKVRPDVLNNFLMNAGMGEAAPAIFEAINKAEASNDSAKAAKLGYEKSQMEYGKTIAQQVDASRDPVTGKINPMLADGVLTMVESHGHAKEAAQFRDMMEKQPEQFDAFVKNLSRGMPTQAQADAHQAFEEGAPARKLNEQGLTPAQAATDKREQQRIGIEQKKADLAAQGAVYKPIEAGTPDYKTAQDLATGKMSVGFFRTLLAYTKDPAKKLAIYNKATEINPQFNEADFERGYKFISNVKTGNQLASLDNAMSGIPDLLKASEEAKRNNWTVVNQIKKPIRIAIGNRVFTDFNAARKAWADELSGGLGFGTASDMKLQMGLDLTDDNLSVDNFASAIQNIVQPFIDRKKQSILNQASVYGDQSNNSSLGGVGNLNQPAGGGKGGGPAQPGEAEWVIVNGKLVKKGG